MTADQTDDTTSVDSRPEFASNPGLLVIVTSLRILALRLDHLRDLVEIVRKNKISEHSRSIRHLEKRLDVQDRVSIEVKVRSLSNSRIERIDAKLEVNHGITTDKSKIGDLQRYPLAQEQVLAYMSRYADEIGREIWKEIQDAYSTDELKLEYAFSYYTILSEPDLPGELAASIFPRAIQQFQDVLGRLARTALNYSGAESLGDLPDIPWQIQKSLGGHGNDIERWAIDRRVDNFVQGGLEEWRDTSLHFAGFDIEDAVGSWETIREAVARMELFDRSAAGTVDAEYLASAGPLIPHDVRIWTRLKTSEEYLHDLLDNIESLAFSMALKWASRFFNVHDSDIDFFITRSVDLERRGRWNSALGVFQTLKETYVHPEHPSFPLTMINIWLCRQQIGTEDEAMRNEIRDFQPKDSMQEAGRCAVNRDWPKLLAAIEDTCGGIGGPFYASKMIQMPLLQRAMKENPQVKLLLERKRNASPRRRSKG